jgi:bifunctional UDP-N-acetylglucosamine pyrophosphorylase / glucosamine-1-phosphate N-acetyltransferase
MNEPLEAPAPSARYALILAAGKGTRMKSQSAKVLHKLCGRPLLAHVLSRLSDLHIDRTFVVVGHEAQAVREAFQDYGIEFVEQQEQQGTGHAVMTAKPKLSSLSGSLLVLYGDTPLITAETLGRLLETREATGAAQVLLTAEYAKPFGYGRIIRNSQGEAIDIIEEKDATPDQKMIREVNVGLNCFDVQELLTGLGGLSPENKAGEYYLTDMVRLLHQAGKRVIALSTPHPEETYGINTREELAQMETRLRAAIARHWMLEGVTILNPSTVFIDETVKIGADTVIYPGVLIEGNTEIGPGCTVYSQCHLKDSVLEAGAVIDHCSVVRKSRIGSGAKVGPFAHLRENCVIGGGARIGNFVEVKKSRLGDGSKAAHLAYVGDAEIGRNVNIGAGTITCNYDGVRKNKTIIEDDVFIGSDSQLIAPVTIHKGAYVAAGSSITEDVPEFSLGIARGRQVNKPGWAHEKAKEKELAKKG